MNLSSSLAPTVTDTRIQSIVIVGGGTAGWMAAAALANRFREGATKITLVESEHIGTVGVGEATVPYIKEFLLDLGINEVDFMRATNATYKLGISFDGWRQAGHTFMHPFASYGSRIAKVPFHHFWYKLTSLGKAKELDAYCLASQIARQGKFALPKPIQDVELSSFNYAFHFDAGLFAEYLKQYSLKLGVTHIEGNIHHANQNNETGFIESIELEGTPKITHSNNAPTLKTTGCIAGELFIDCSGFNGILIEKTLKTGFEDWGHWLKCDRAVAQPCKTKLAPASYTRSLACTAGWQWRIPLQQRVGNGYVYSSAYCNDEEAVKALSGHMEGEPLTDPKMITFKTGMRKKTWNKNVFCLGLASGFLEPLESTSIYMIQSALNTLLNHFPNKHFPPALTDEANRQLNVRQHKLRDFLILHYVANGRQGEPFWEDYRAMWRNQTLPSSLLERIEYYQQTGQPPTDELDFFGSNSWLAMYAGLGIQPEYYHPVVDDFEVNLLEREFATIANSIQQAIAPLPSHQAFIETNILSK